MADTNFSLEAGASASVTGSAIGGTNPDDNIRDDDVGTSDCYYGGPANHYADINAEVTFNSAHRITSIASLVYDWGTHDNSFVTSATEYLDYYNGSWNNAATRTPTFYSSETKVTWTATGAWTNVTKIRYRANVTFTGGTTYYGFFVYEIRGWGLDYIDSGIRIRTSAGTLTIAAIALSSHKLRIRKGGTTYGFPLVATGDGSASPMRFYDGASTKAFTKM